MSLALVVDVGTTNIKAGLVDPEGQVVSQASQGLEVHRPEKGAAEHDPQEVLASFKNIVRKTVNGSDEEVKVLGLTGYQFGFLPLDKDGEPLTGIMTLMDERPKSVMGKFQNRSDLSEIYRRTGCPPLFAYQLPKLLWLREEKPEIFDRSRYFADVKSYLLKELVGKFVTDSGIASSSQLFNINDRTWDDQLMEMAGVNRDQLPEVGGGEEILGTIRDGLDEELGIDGSAEVVLGVYDGGAMVLGLGGVDGQDGVCNLGTTAMMRTCSEKPVMDEPERRRLQTYSLLPGKWAIGGAINNAGVGLRWFRDNFQPSRDYSRVIAEAAGVEPGSGGVFSLPYFTGERDPRIGNLASGSFFGLKDYHEKAHMVRAILEGVAYSLNFVREAMVDNNIEYSRIRIGGSGARSDLWPQIIADVTELPVRKTITEDTTLIGGAMIGYKAIGFYDSLLEASQAMVQTGKEFVPVDNNVKRYEQGYEFFKKLVREFSKLYPLHDEKFSPGS